MKKPKTIKQCWVEIISNMFMVAIATFALFQPMQFDGIALDIWTVLLFGAIILGIAFAGHSSWQLGRLQETMKLK